MNNRSQAVRLHKEFQFATKEVFIRMQRDEVIRSARQKDLSQYLASGAVAPEGDMDGVEDQPLQERNFLMPRYMVDTVISSYIMGRKNRAVMRRFEKTPVEEMCISFVPRAELAFGVQIHPKRDQASLALEDYLKYIEVLDLPSEAAIDYAEIRADLKSEGNLDRCK